MNEENEHEKLRIEMSSMPGLTDAQLFNIVKKLQTYKKRLEEEILCYYENANERTQAHNQGIYYGVQYALDLLVSSIAPPAHGMHIVF